MPKTRNDCFQQKWHVNGPGHNLLVQFFTPDSSKIEVSETCFFDIVTTQSKVCKACFRPYLRVFHPIWVLGPGGGSPKGLVHNLLMQFFTPDSSKIEVSETCFFDIVTTQYDHPRYVKHVLGRIYVFFTRYGY